MAAALNGNRASVSSVDVCNPRGGILYLIRERGCGLGLKQTDVWSYGSPKPGDSNDHRAIRGFK